MASSSPSSPHTPAVVPFVDAAVPPDTDDAMASIAQKLAALDDDTLSNQDKEILAIFTNLVLRVSQRQVSEEDTRDSSPADSKNIQTLTAVPVATTATGVTAIGFGTISPTAASAATQIRMLCPDPSLTEDLEVYLMALWQTVILVAKAVPYDNALQDELVAVLESLRSHAKTTVTLWGREERLWRDLPLLSSFMREAWFEPGPEDEEATEDESRDQVSEWVNLNAFAARIMEKGLVQWTVFAVMGIAKGLEYGHEPPQNEECTDGEPNVYFEARAQTASQWLLLGGTEVFRNAFRRDQLDNTELQATPPGPLYVASGGRPGLNMNRWWFWKKRLEELASADEAYVSAMVCTEALQAARHMDDIVAHDGRVIVRILGSDDDTDSVVEKPKDGKY